MTTRRVKTGGAYIPSWGLGVPSPPQWQNTYVDQVVAGAYVADPGGGPDQWQYRHEQLGFLEDSEMGNQIVLVGDSIVARNNMDFAPSGITHSAGVITVICASHGLYTGAKVMLSKATDEAYNGIFTVTWVSSNVFTVPAVTTPVSDTAVPIIGFVGYKQDRLANLGWFNSFNQQSGSPFQIVANAAFTGALASQLSHSLTRDVLPLTSNWVLIGTGINDVIAGTSIATVYANIVAGCERVTANGRRVLLSSLPLMGSATSGYTATIAQNIMALNRDLEAYARSANGVTYMDIFSPVFASQVGAGITTVLTPITNATDLGMHPSALGADLIGLALKTKYVNQFAPQYWLPVSGFEDQNLNALSTQIADNPLFNGTTGTFGAGTSGVMPTLWECVASAGTYVAATTARADLFGNDAVITCAPTADNHDMRLQSKDTYHDRLSAGDRYYMVSEITLSSLTTLKEIEQYVEITVGGVTYTHVSVGSFNNSTAFGQTARTLTYVSPIVTVPASMTLMIAKFQATFSATGAGQVVAVGRQAIFKV